jgi:hypothetical protein
MRFWIGSACALVAYVVMGYAVTGCMTGEDKATLDAIAGNSSQPYVEAFVEYRGPQARWAAPATWTVHVVAKEGEKPQVTVPPAWRNEEATTTARRPASQLITGEEARVKIGELASAIGDSKSGFTGCLYPIHARLIRGDGNVLDKEGCRGQSSWDKAASEWVDYFMAAAGK